MSRTIRKFDKKRPFAGNRECRECKHFSGQNRVCGLSVCAFKGHRPKTVMRDKREKSRTSDKWRA